MTTHRTTSLGLRALVGVAALVAAAGATAADAYPSKPIRIIVPYSAGGTVDLVARVLVQQLSVQMKAQFIVDNRPGASGVIGSDAAAKSPADGYTLLVQSPTLVANPLMLKKIPYNVARDFTAISLLGSVPMVFTVNASLPVKTLPEFIARARANPKDFSFGTSAIGSPMHIAEEAIKHDAKLDVLVVPYKGTANALNDLLGGQTSAMIDAIPSSASHIAGGKLRALAVTSKSRVASLPSVPTVAESGLPGLAGFDMVSWYGLWGPANLPPEIVNRLATEVAKAMKSPLVAEHLGSQSFVPAGSTPAEFSAYIATQTSTYARIVKDATFRSTEARPFRPADFHCFRGSHLRPAMERCCPQFLEERHERLFQDHRWLSINTATLRKQRGVEQSLPEILETCARRGIRAISPWRDQVAAAGLKATSQAVRGHEFALSGYCRGGMFTATDDAGLRLAREDNQRALDEGCELNAACLVLVVGALPGALQGQAAHRNLALSRQQVFDGIGELLQKSREQGMPLAIEPLHPMYAADRACVNTMEQALDICDALDPVRSGALGVAVDMYHVWWDPKLKQQIDRAGKERLLAFHVCDWLTPTTDLLNDRGMMGDGVIDIRQARGWVEAQGFTGYAEVEIFSHRWWRQSGDDILGACIDRHKQFV